MSDELLFIPETLLTVIRMVAFLVFILAVSALFLTVFVHTDLNYAKKTVREVGSFILASSATDGRGIFVIEELDKYKMGDEPFGKHCSFGYKLEIESYDKDKPNKWAFGFDPGLRGVDNDLTASQEFPIGLRHRGSENVEYSGKMKLTLSETLLTKLSCAIESSYEHSAKQELHYKITLPVYMKSVGGVKDITGGGTATFLDFYLTKKGEELCAVDPSNMEALAGCRKITAPFKDFHIRFKYGNREIYEGMRFAAIPIKKGANVNVQRCDKVQEDSIAASMQDTGIVILCIEDPELELRSV